MDIAFPALVGVISDTHGALDPRTLDHFEGVGLILHAGDVGSPSILMELGLLAPVVAVRGNTDEARWAEELPPAVRLRVGPYLIDVAHDPTFPPAPAADVVVRGHTHRPRVERSAGTLHVNPGSVSQPRGTRSSPTVALLELDERGARARIVTL